MSSKRPTTTTTTTSLTGSDPGRARLGSLLLHPGVLLLVGACLPPLISLIPSERTYRLLWRTQRYVGVPEATTFVVIGVVAALVAGGAARARWSGLRSYLAADSQVERCARAGRRLLQISVVSYVGWALVALARGLSPAAIAEAFSGDPGALSELKESVLSPVAGLSTSSQFAGLGIGLAFMAHRSGRRMERSTVRLVIVVVTFAVCRSFLYAERLALLEVLLPVVAVTVLGPRGRATGAPSRRAAVLAIPGGVAAFVGLYLTQEYYRSWVPHYRDEYPGTFTRFAAERLSGYYATAVNNAVIFDRFAESPPMWTVTEPLRAVLGDDLLYGTSRFASWELTLERHGNPELNNFGGFFAAFADTGVAFPVVVGAVAVLLGATYHAAVTRSNVAAVPAYGALCLAALEFSRIPYPFLARGLFPTVGAIAVMLYVKGPIGRGTYASRHPSQAPATQHRREPHVRVGAPSRTHAIAPRRGGDVRGDGRFGAREPAVEGDLGRGSRPAE